MLVVVLSPLSTFQIAHVRVRFSHHCHFFIIKDCDLRGLPLRALTLISLLVCLKVASNVRVSTAKVDLLAFDSGGSCKKNIIVGLQSEKSSLFEF